MCTDTANTDEGYGVKGKKSGKHRDGVRMSSSSAWAHKVRLRRADWEQCVSGPKEKGGGAKNVGLHKLEKSKV